MPKRIVLLELNEVPFRVIDAFRRWRPQSCLARLAPRMRELVTVTEDAGHLTPWSTWPTLHRGVTNERHCIGHFGQPLADIDREFPPVWDLLARAGVRTGVFGSLHSYPQPDDLSGYAFHVPDTFAAGSETFPEDLSVFQDFNLRAARDSTRNVSISVPWGAALRVLRAAPDLGLKPRTLLAAAGQLVAERVVSWRRVRRRTLQARLGFDVFMEQLERTQPDFATCFTNHVASSMHRYWAAAWPEDYEEFDYTDEWVSRYRGEIDHVMRQADAMIRRLVDFADRHPSYQIVVATSMGQAATRTEHITTQLLLTDLSRLLRHAGLREGEWRIKPAMAPSVNFVVPEDRAPAVRALLERLVVFGKRLRHHEDVGGFFSVTLGHHDPHAREQVAMVGERCLPFAELGLEAVPLQDVTGSCAYHVAEGSLLVYDPEAAPAARERGEISTVDIAPWILKNFGVPVPDHVRGTAFA